MHKNLDCLLYNCLEGIITNFNFDIKNNKILISLFVEHIDRIDDYQIILFNVASYYFINSEGERRFNSLGEPPDRLYISSFDYMPDGIGKINISSNKEWTKYDYSGANFILEICDLSFLFIEAEAIQINDQYFNVGFPKI